MAIGIIGCGAWGTALAFVIASSYSNKVILWARDQLLVQSVNLNRCNPNYLKDLKLPDNVYATADMGVMSGCDMVLVVVPVRALDEVVLKLKLLKFPTTVPMVICSKGIDTNTLLLPLDLASSVCDNPLAFFAGPNFASEIASGKPACASLASEHSTVFAPLVQLLDSQIKLHLTDDIIGVQVCAAAKNVVAIASGIIDSLGLGNNVKAALITKGIQSIAKLSKSFGGREDTIMEPCGIGDLVLTCSSPNSRNYLFGFHLIDKGKNFVEAQVIEGQQTLRALKAILDQNSIEIKLFEAIYSVVYDGDPPEVLLEHIL